MSSTVAAILTVGALSGWHLRTRRHPCWSASPTARFCIAIGYAAVAIAVFWLTEATTATGWEWAIGNFWALGAMVSFVYGFSALDGACEQRRHASMTIESIDPSVDDAAPTFDQGSNGSSLT